MSLFGRFRRRNPVVPLEDDGTLVVVGACDDPSRADSAVVADLRAAGVDTEGGRFLVRYALVLPDAAAVDEAARLLEPDGWRVAVDPGARDGGVRVRASRETPLAGLALSRERGRMAGLAQRLGGSDDGWDVMTRPNGARQV